MSNPSEYKKKISRRGFFPILGSTFLLPLLGFGETVPKQTIDKEKTMDNGEEYETLLKPDGTAVKVKSSTLKKSKVIKKNISNSSFLSWLGRKM